jgi:DNA-binding MarR family transcriptional regulator
MVQYLARLMTADFFARISVNGIAPAQTYVLRELWRAETLSQVEISQRLDIGKATTGQTLRRLERAGLVERKRSPEDGRIIIVHLTAKGRALREPLAVAAREQVADIAKMLGEKNAHRLEELLKILLESYIDRPKR